MMDQVSPPNWADAAYLRLSDDQRAEQKQRVLDTSPYADEFWVFGFGSLMWNPGVETVAQQTAT
ncbi:MAG: hypothetical protein HOK25_08390, partial [Rhodospirillaceae bacterium]|nr:hypothetical protein [Rhodospirillaceae bacterium]